MSSPIENAGRLRTPLTKGAAAFLALTLLAASGPAAAQTAAPLFDDPMRDLLQQERSAAPAARPAPAPRPAAAAPFEPSPEARFQNRPAAPAPAAAQPAANLGFSAQPTRLDAQSLGQVGAQVGARSDEIVQGAAQRWGLTSSTLYMLGALLGLLGLLLLARLFGLGQKPARPAKRKAAARRPATRAEELIDDWEQEPAEAPARRVLRQTPPRQTGRPAGRAAAPAEGWDEDWGDEPQPVARRSLSAHAVEEMEEPPRARATRRPNLDRLAASIRETWPKGEAYDEPAAAHRDAPVSPARAAAARVAREFAAETYEEEAPAPRRPTRSAPRGGDFLDALEAAGEGEPAGLDRIRPLTRSR